MSTRSPASILAALRQVACFDAPAGELAAEAVALVNRLVGFDLAFLFEFDAACDIVDVHLAQGMPPELLAEYAACFHNRPEGDGVYGETAGELARSDRKLVTASSRASERDLRRTEVWNRICRPLDIGWTVQMPLRAGGRPVGQLALTRDFSRDFGPGELRLLEDVQPWLGHVLAAKGTGTHRDPLDLATEDAATLVVDGDGRLAAASADGLRLLHHLCGEALDPALAAAEPSGAAHAFLRRTTMAVAAALSGAPARVPATTVENRYGRFQVRAYALHRRPADDGLQVSIHIERRVPLRLGLFRRPAFLALSPRQRQVCLGILDGRAAAEIAAELNVRPSSVLDYTKSLYARLGIHKQAEILPALLAGT